MFAAVLNDGIISFDTGLNCYVVASFLRLQHSINRYGQRLIVFEFKEFVLVAAC